MAKASRVIKEAEYDITGLTQTEIDMILSGVNYIANYSRGTRRDEAIKLIVQLKKYD